jgi:hypothetical protein
MAIYKPGQRATDPLDPDVFTNGYRVNVEKPAGRQSHHLDLQQELQNFISNIVRAYNGRFEILSFAKVGFVCSVSVPSANYMLLSPDAVDALVQDLRFQLRKNYPEVDMTEITRMCSGETPVDRYATSYLRVLFSRVTGLGNDQFRDPPRDIKPQT